MENKLQKHDPTIVIDLVTMGNIIYFHNFFCDISHRHLQQI
jgi:hypothetical protein